MKFAANACSDYHTGDRSVVVLHHMTFLHSTAKEGLASPHSIPGWEKNVLWFTGIFKPITIGKELVLVERVRSNVVLPVLVQQKTIRLDR